MKCLVKLKTAVFSMVAGFVFSIGDMAHIHSGMARYPNWQGPFFFNIPWWIPLEFACAAFLLIQVHPIQEKIFRLTPPRNTGSAALVASLFWTLAIYLGTSFLPESHPILKNASLLLALAAQIAYFGMSHPGSLLEILSVAICGCGFEFLLGQMNFFTYLPSPSLVATIPVWLWCVYGSVAITARVYSAGGSGLQ
ncbi:MAG: hypothetical protein HYW49_05525 [Deltaproteobacteria bacterium]|nr:hypothetical protein [Deltaproteobacteria bacterium]